MFFETVEEYDSFAMKRTVWIAGFCVALVMFVFMLTICVVDLVVRKHLNIAGWEMLVCSVLGAWYVFRRIRVTLAHGDPTADLETHAK